MEHTYTFICNAYQDLGQLALNLPELRRCYPGSRIVIISDGDPDSRYAALADSYECEFVFGQRLYTLQSGGQIVARLLDTFLDGPGEFLVKFDTDTRFFRPFETRPPDAPSGSIWGAYGFRYIQGGCRILSRECAQALVDSGLLTGRRYRDIAAWCPPIAEEYYKRQGRVSEDFIVRDLLLELDIDIRDHPEVFSAGHVKRWRAMDAQTLRRVVNTDRRFAVTHPWKLADVKWAARFAPILGSAVTDLSVDMLELEDVEPVDTSVVCD